MLARLLLLALAIVVAPRDGTEVRHPTIRPAPRFVVLDDWIRDSLAVEWDRHQGDPVILERGYCVHYQRDIWAGEWAWRGTQLTKPDTTGEATSNGIAFVCVGPMVATLHVHPPTTCLYSGECVRGGPYAWQCLPSDQDRRYLAWTGHPFLLIQCSREAIIAVWPGT